MTARAARAIALAIISYSSLLPTGAQSADAPAKLVAAVDGAFRPLLDKHDIPGMAVSVTVAGQQYFFSYGVAEKGGKKLVTKDTLFEIGSVSKPLTATLATYAQALGKLSLDDPPGKHMPELRGSALDRATLLHLGTYTAGGLPLQFPGQVRNEGEMARFFTEWKAGAAPGEQRRYSNPSIGLLGHLTARAMKGDFADLMERELFPKLGLTQSYIRVPKAETDRYAWGHGSDGKPIRVNPGVLATEAYGVKSTAADMVRFVEANIRPAALDPAMRRAVEDTQVGHFRVGEMVQGLGWEQYPYPVALERLLAGNSTAIVMQPNPATRLASEPSSPARLFNKTGSTNGFGAYVAFVPQRRIGVVMLANKNFPVPARLAAAHAVLEQLSAEGQ